MEPSGDGRRALLASFTGSIEPIPPTSSYRNWSIAAALTMAGLVGIYVSILLGLGFGIFSYATRGTGVFFWFDNFTGRFVAFLVAYCAPIAVASALTLFLAKPIFFRRTNPPQSIPLPREQQPFLYEFVEKLCDAMHAPHPRRIEVIATANASVRWTRLPGQRRLVLVLTLGLPFVSCLDLIQLTGILAHEIGHFTQRFGTLSHRYSTNFRNWLWRVIYERDSWDEKLESLSAQSTGIPLGPLLIAITQNLIRLSRILLWGLLKLSDPVWANFSRQMEKNADRHAYHVLGNRYSSTLEEIPVITASFEESLQGLDQALREGQLVDDLPQLIAWIRSELEPETRQQILGESLQVKTQTQDTHDALQERLALAVDSPSIFSETTEPATVLFDNYAALCRKVTTKVYADHFQIEAEKIETVETPQIADSMRRQRLGFRAAGRFFQGSSLLKSYLLLKGTKPPPMPSQETLEKRIREHYVAFERQRDEIVKHQKEFEELDEARDAILRAQALHQAGLGSFPRNAAAVEEALQKARERSRSTDELLAERVWFARKYAEIAGGDYGDLKRVDECLLTLETLAAHEPELQGFRARHMGLSALIGEIEEEFDNERLGQALERELRDMVTKFREIRTTFKPLPYPFPHAREDANVGDYLVPEIPDDLDLETTQIAALATSENLFVLIQRCQFEIAIFGEQVDHALGLDPLPAPLVDPKVPDAPEASPR